MRIFGYARVSTRGQSLDEQVGELIESGVPRSNLFSEKFTGTKTNRPEFNKMLKKVEVGDVIVTQSIFDVSNEENQGQEGMIFAFDESSERKEILNHMQIEDTEENRKWLEGMLQGQCLLKGIYGKVGKITVHCLFEEMDKASKTVDKGVSGSIEEKYALI